jgi:hypothetical protein
MPLNGNIVPQTYYDDSVDSPYPTTSIPINTAPGQILTCSRTGRMWLEGVVAPFYIPLALQYQTTSAGSGTTTANIRRVNNGTAGSEVAGFEHTGAVQLTDLPSAPMLGTDATGRIVSVTSAPAVTITAKNDTASTITKGTVVRISGAQGQNPTIAPAQANAYATADAIGVAAETILHTGQAIGKVMVSGTLTDVDTSAFSDGATLYLSAATAGALTATEPVKPNWQMQIGTVQHAHPTQGKILINTHLESTKTEYITDMTSAGETLATLAPLNEGVVLGRKSSFGAGNPEEIAIGYGMFALGNLAVSLTTAQTKLAASVAMLNANDWYDGPTVSLSAGTWLVTATLSLRKQNATGAFNLSARISDGTTHHASAGQTWITQVSSNLSINMTAIVNLGATTTIRASANSSLANCTILSATDHASSGANASVIAAVRIA